MAVRSTMLSAATMLAVFLALPFVHGDHHGGANQACIQESRVLGQGDNHLSVNCTSTLVYIHPQGTGSSTPLYIFVRPCQGEVDFNVTRPTGQSCDETSTEMFKASQSTTNPVQAGNGTSLGQRTYTLDSSNACAGNYTIEVLNADDHTPKHAAEINVLITTDTSHGVPALPAQNQVEAYCGSETGSVQLRWTAATGSVSHCVYYHLVDDHDDHDVHGSTCRGQLSIMESTLAGCDVTSPYTVKSLKASTGYDFDVVVRNSANTSLTSSYVAVRLTTCAGSGASTAQLFSSLPALVLVALTLLWGA